MLTRLHSKALALALVALNLSAGCKKDDAPPETPPPEKAPPVEASASLRPHYLLAKGNLVAGTAFVVRSKAGQLYMLTAAHVLDNIADWRDVRGVSLHAMDGEAVARVKDRPVFVGKAMHIGGVPSDLIIWPLADDARVAPLKLASEDPKRNDWLWAVGQEMGSNDPQKLYRCRLIGSESGGFALVQHDRFDLRGFSGGPIVNAKGEVVGSLLAGKSPDMLMSAVSSIRQRLKEAGVEVE